MEIERKYLVKELPSNLSSFPHNTIKQGYISTTPVVRIRQLGDDYILTIKGRGLLAREEHELFISFEEFQSLSAKVESHIISKTRYYIPFPPYTIELDIFHSEFEGLIIAEVEFNSIEDSQSFTPPGWFGKEVTNDPSYHNSNLSKKT